MQEKLLREELEALADLKKTFSKIPTAQLFQRAAADTEVKIARARQAALERAKKSGNGNSKKVQKLLGTEGDFG